MQVRDAGGSRCQGRSWAAWRRPSLVLAVPVATLVLAAGCGGGTSARAIPAAPPSPTSAAQKAPSLVLKQSHDAFVAASSVRVKGTVGSGASAVTVDLRLVKGKGAVGRLSTAKGAVDVIRSGGTAFLRGNDAFVSDVVGPQAAAVAKGKWLRGPVDKLVPGLSQLTDQSAFAALFDAADKVTSGGPTTFAGHPALKLVSSTGGVLLVELTGAERPLQISRTTGGKPGRLTFSEYGKRVTVSVPKDAITLRA